MIDLNTVTKEDFVDYLILNANDCKDFYYPREQKLLSLDFDFKQMKIDFENWLIINCE